MAAEEAASPQPDSDLACTVTVERARPCRSGWWPHVTVRAADWRALRDPRTAVLGLPGRSAWEIAGIQEPARRQEVEYLEAIAHNSVRAEGLPRPARWSR